MGDSPRERAMEESLINALPNDLPPDYLMRRNMMNRLSPVSRARFSLARESWGTASLHPRLYAIAALRGLISTTSTCKCRTGN